MSYNKNSKTDIFLKFKLFSVATTGSVLSENDVGEMDTSLVYKCKTENNAKW